MTSTGARLRLLRSVRARTVVAATVVVAIALGAGAVGLLWLISNRLVAAERSAAALRAQDLAALATAGRLPSSLSFPGEDGGLAQVVNAAGSVVATTENLDGEPPVASFRPATGQAQSGVRGGLPIGGDSRFVVVALGAETPTGPVTVLTGASLEGADETRSIIAAALAAGYPVLLVVVALVARSAVGRALQPVEAIRAEVADLGERDLHRRVPEPGTGDEIDRLAGTMNIMLGRLEASAARQRRFIADASHELRSPVASLRTVLEVAAAHPESTTTQETVADALVDTLRLQRLVIDLLMLARLDDPAAPHRAAAVNLAAVCAAEADRCGDPRLRARLPEQAIVNGDQAQLGRAVINLLENAAHHARSTIELSIDDQGDGYAVHVDDDGPGIPPQDWHRVFERFTRLDEARTSDDGGSGLGLSIVAELARAHHGSVTVGHSPLGGARFTLTLPAASAPNRPGRPEPGSPSAPLQPARRTINGQHTHRHMKELP